LLVAVLVVVPAAAGQEGLPSSPAPVTSAASPPVVAAPAPAPASTAPAPASTTSVRVMRVPDRLTASGLSSLADALAAGAGAGGTLVVVPVDAAVTGTVSGDTVGKLAEVTRLTVVLVPGGAGGDAARVLSAFAEATYALDGATLGAVRDDRLLARVAPRSRCNGCEPPVTSVADVDGLREAMGTTGGKTFDRHDLPTTSMASALGGVTARGGGGGAGGALKLAVLALIALGLALAGRALLASRGTEPRTAFARSRQGAAPSPMPVSSPPARAGGRRPRKAVTVHLPTSGDAIVRSELQPDGYVELAQCLRRARWTDTRTPPPATGEWVHVETDRDGLVASTIRPAMTPR
jgi:hypothetical protein